jgi:hypothetical protein
MREGGETVLWTSKIRDYRIQKCVVKARNSYLLN